MATIVTPTTITASVNSLNGTQKTDLQTALGIGGTAPGASAADVAMATIRNSVPLPAGASSSSALSWTSITNPTTGFGSFTGAGNSVFRFSKDVVATVSVGIGAYLSLSGSTAPTLGNMSVRLYHNSTSYFGGSSKWVPHLRMYVSELGTALVWKFAAGDEVSVRMDMNALDNIPINPSMSGYGAWAGGSSYFSIAV